MCILEDLNFTIEEKTKIEEKFEEVHATNRKLEEKIKRMKEEKNKMEEEMSMMEEEKNKMKEMKMTMELQVADIVDVYEKKDGEGDEEDEEIQTTCHREGDASPLCIGSYNYFSYNYICHV